MRGPVSQLEPAFPGEASRLCYASGGAVAAAVVRQGASEFPAYTFTRGIRGVGAVTAVCGCVEDGSARRLIVEMVNGFEVAVPNAGFIRLVCGNRRIAVAQVNRRVSGVRMTTTTTTKGLSSGTTYGT